MEPATDGYYGQQQQHKQRQQRRAATSPPNFGVRTDSSSYSYMRSRSPSIDEAVDEVLASGRVDGRQTRAGEASDELASGGVRRAPPRGGAPLWGAAPPAPRGGGLPSSSSAVVTPKNTRRVSPFDDAAVPMSVAEAGTRARGRGGDREQARREGQMVSRGQEAPGGGLPRGRASAGHTPFRSRRPPIVHREPSSRAVLGLSPSAGAAAAAPSPSPREDQVPPAPAKLVWCSNPRRSRGGDNNQNKSGEAKRQEKSTNLKRVVSTRRLWPLGSSTRLGLTSYDDAATDFNGGGSAGADVDSVSHAGSSRWPFGKRPAGGGARQSQPLQPPPPAYMDTITVPP